LAGRRAVYVDDDATEVSITAFDLAIQGRAA
jgi:hypothetical protein